MRVYIATILYSSIGISHWFREFREYGTNSFHGKGKPKLTDDQRKASELQNKLRDSELKKTVNPKLQLAHHLKDTLCLSILSSRRATGKIYKIDKGTSPFFRILL